MNRKNFIGGLLAISVAPNMVKEEIYDDFDYIDEQEEGASEYISKGQFNFRDLVTTKTIDGSELHFVRYKQSL